MTFKEAWKEHRMAQVAVSITSLYDDPGVSDKLQALLCKTLVINAEFKHDRNAIVYLMISPMFEPGKEGEEAPFQNLLRVPTYKGRKDWEYEFFA